MAEFTTTEATARLRAMLELIEGARALELEGCGVRLGIDGGRVWLNVDFGVKRVVDPLAAAVDRWGKGEGWPEGLSTAPADLPEPAPMPAAPPATVSVAPQTAPVAAPAVVLETKIVRPDALPPTGHLAPWTDAADVELGLMLSKGRSWSEIARATGRSEGALQQRVKRHGGKAAVIAFALKAAAAAPAPDAGNDPDPDAPGALEAHLERVSPSGDWSREMDRELIRLACLGWSAAEVDAQDLTGVGRSAKARKGHLTQGGRWSIYEVAAALGVDAEACAA